MKNRFNFRGYNKNLKKWFYGGYITQAEYTDRPFKRPGTKPAPVNHFIIFEEPGDWGLPTKLKLALVDKKSVGQCTGLRDKYGKLIYEGDIIKYTDCEGKETIGSLERDRFNLLTFANMENCDFCEEWADVVKAVFFTGNSTMEVIDNIYENKELLKEQK